MDSANLNRLISPDFGDLDEDWTDAEHQEAFGRFSQIQVISFDEGGRPSAPVVVDVMIEDVYSQVADPATGKLVGMAFARITDKFGNSVQLPVLPVGAK